MAVICEDLLNTMKTEEGLSEQIIVGDEMTFHLSEQINRYNIWAWGSKNPHAEIEMKRDSPKVNMFCAVSRRCMLGSVFLSVDSVR